MPAGGSCRACAGVDGLALDFAEGDQLPPQAHQLTRVAYRDLGWGELLYSCPACGGHFLCELKTDNDIFQPMDYRRYRAASAEQVSEFLRDVEAEALAASPAGRKRT